MRTIMTTLAGALLVTAIFEMQSVATAEEPASRPPRFAPLPEAPPRINVNNVGNVGTAPSAAGHARAEQIRAYADFIESSSRAGINTEVARQLWIQSKLQLIRNRHELRAAHMEAWAARERRLARQRERALARQASVRREASLGLAAEADWPQVVHSEEARLWSDYLQLTAQADQSVTTR